MAGHSKWHNIKHRKAAVDKKRGKVWTKIAKAIIVAAKNGGPDPASNLTLRYAIDEARYANMPRDTIERAIKKGAGAGEGENFEQIRYEGYGAGGVAIVVDALTDNRTRTATDVRNAFNKNGGNLGTTGCVAFLFNARGEILVEAPASAEEKVMEAAIEAGAIDVQPPSADASDAEAPLWTILTEVTDFASVKDAVESAGLKIAEARLTLLPETNVVVKGDQAKQVMELIEALEDLDDVQKVYSNADIPDEELAALS